MTVERICFGYVGDRIGRKCAFHVLIVRMDVLTFLIDLMLTCNRIGIAVADILVLLFIILIFNDLWLDNAQAIGFVEPLVKKHFRDLFVRASMVTATGGKLIGAFLGDENCN